MEKRRNVQASKRQYDALTEGVALLHLPYPLTTESGPFAGFAISVSARLPTDLPGWT